MTTVAPSKQTPVVRLKHELVARTNAYAALLPRGYAPQRLIIGALVAASNNPELQKCDPTSVALALARIAQWGLDVGDTAHLVPYKAKCTPIADYKGYIKLMMDAGARKVVSEVVREGDFFEWQRGTEEYIKHTGSRNLKKKITHAYCIVWLKYMVPYFEIMTIEEIDQVRQQHSHSWKNGPVPEWYARKSVLRRARKYVPTTPQLSLLVRDDDREIPEGLDVSDLLEQMGDTGPRPAGVTPDGEVKQPAPVAIVDASDQELDAKLAREEQGDAFES